MKITINLFYLVVAFYGTLPLNLIKFLKSVTRISTNQLIFIGMLIALISLLINILYIQSIGYNIEIDSGIFNLFTSASLATSIKRKKEIHWDDYIINLKLPSLLTNSLIEKMVNQFWDTKINKINEKNHIICLFRAQTESGAYFTLGQMQKLNKEDKEYYIQWIKDILSLKSNDYKDQIIVKIMFSFGIRKGIAPEKRIIKQTKNFQNYRHYKLPVTMNPLKYGINPISISKSLYIVSVTALTIAKINIKTDGENHVELYKSGNLVLSYTDKLINEGIFLRTIGKNQYTYKFDQQSNKWLLDLFTVKKVTKRIQSIEQDKNLNNKLITMDLETYVSPRSNNLIPYLISIFDGNKTKSFYLSDYNNSEEMLQSGITELMTRKYHGYKIYLHNFGKFDAIFLIKELIKLGIMTPIIHKGRIISVNLSFFNNNKSKPYKLTFRDSLLLLLSSLRKLGKFFKVDVTKGYFPHRFVTPERLNYIGPVPAFEFFDNITLEEYNSYSAQFNNNWSLKNEAIKYCEIDCISLYQIMIKFINLMWDLYRINVNKYPTLPSLVSALFRIKSKNIIENNFIAQLSGEIANNIRIGYTGGATDMYIPSNEEGELVYGYDVNALYPSVMAKFEMPIGNPSYFEGDIKKYHPDAFGFFYCKVTTPDKLEHPIIQIHVNTNAGKRTVAGLGKFEGMFFSAEIDNAIKYGYKFEILWGYTFEKGFIFKDFILELYKTRISYPKDDPMNYIHKILSNSLYGKMGMNDSFPYTILIPKDKYLKFETKWADKIMDIKSLDDNYLIQVKTDDTKDLINPLSSTHNVNVAISSAITAYARIAMTHFKNNPNIKLFYSDTDSIYTNLNPDQMNALFPGIINNTELGKLKLENISKKAIFIAPKVYYLKTIEGEEIFKVKGLNKNITLTEKDFDNLLMKDKIITLNQSKLYRSLEEGTIEIKDLIYTLQQTENKRKLIFSDNKLVNTNPFKIDKDDILAD